MVSQATLRAAALGGSHYDCRNRVKFSFTISSSNNRDYAVTHKYKMSCLPGLKKKNLLRQPAHQYCWHLGCHWHTQPAMSISHHLLSSRGCVSTCVTRTACYNDAVCDRSSRIKRLKSHLCASTNSKLDRCAVLRYAYLLNLKRGTYRRDFGPEARLRELPERHHQRRASQNKFDRRLEAAAAGTTIAPQSLRANQQPQPQRCRADRRNKTGAHRDKLCSSLNDLSYLSHRDEDLQCVDDANAVCRVVCESCSPKYR